MYGEAINEHGYGEKWKVIEWVSEKEWKKDVDEWGDSCEKIARVFNGCKFVVLWCSVWSHHQLNLCVGIRRASRNTFVYHERCRKIQMDFHWWENVNFFTSFTIAKP